MATEPLAARLAGFERVWDPETDDRLICRAVVEETHDVRTFVLAPEPPCAFRFEPGQFLTFTFEIDGRRINRCYTISSPPTRPGAVTITVKRVPGGPVSNFLHDHLRVGTSVRAVGPMGVFSTLRHPAEKYLFLSGGSGITPLLSITRTYADLAEDRDIVFVHAARTPRDIICRAELDLLARRLPRLRLAHLVESTDGEPGWPGLVGRIDAARLALLAPDLPEREVFCCGPAPFMAAVRRLLTAAGCDLARYHEESFVFEDHDPTETAVAGAAAAPDVPVHTITFAKSGRTVPCPADTFILAAARRAGLALPSSCTKGLCGTCKSRKLAGEVDMRHQGGIRQREIDQGLVLICCSKPLGDVTIDR